jgi:hypothetical protein
MLLDWMNQCEPKGVRHVGCEKCMRKVEMNERPYNESSKPNYWALIGLLTAALAIWLAWVPILRFLAPDSDIDYLAHLGDAFGGVNALFSAFAFAALVFTLLLQRDQIVMTREELRLQREELNLTREQLQKTAAANASVATDTKANAVFEMYQVFTSPTFWEVRCAAWRVFVMCVQSKTYFDHFISTFFVTRSREKRINAELVSCLRGRYCANQFPDEQSLIDTEYLDRHYAVDLMNFFNTLALRESPVVAYERCHFAYDWWRPWIWFVSRGIERYYAKLSDTERRYTTPPTWQGMLPVLDRYYKLKLDGSDTEQWDLFCKHPLILSLKLDKSHTI